MSSVQSERVLVVPTAVFRELGYFQGFTGKVETYLPSLFEARHLSFRPRGEVEEDPSFKQLIPYVLFRYLDAAGRAQVFQYTRGSGMGEGRLHRKRSVGIGGHISADDVAAAGAVAEITALRGGLAESSTAGNGVYEVGMRRELDEEVEIQTPYRARCVGLINDDETPVGRVHLGVVHLFDVEEPRVAPREPDICESGFRPVEEILSALEGFETWSQICLRALFGREGQ